MILLTNITLVIGKGFDSNSMGGKKRNRIENSLSSSIFVYALEWRFCAPHGSLNIMPEGQLQSDKKKQYYDDGSSG